MAVAASPFYYAGDSNLGATIGQSLGRALFGNPQAAMKQQLIRSQMAEQAAQAAEAYSRSAQADEDTRGARIGNDARASLPQQISGMFLHTPAAPAAPADPLAPLPDASAAPAPTAPANVQFDPQTFRNGLPAVVAAMAQAEGKDVKPGEVLNALTAYEGNDEFARRGLVADGRTPGKDFALTPERADQIAQAGYNADLNKATTVEGMRGAVTERGQDLQHLDRRYATNTESGDRRYAADKSYEGRIGGAEISASGGRVGGWSPRVDVGGDNSNAAVDGKEALMSQRLGIGMTDKIDPSRIPQVFDAIAATEGPVHNNNPGNIKDSPFARNQPGYVGRDANGFAVFNSPQAGRQAGIALLGTYFGRGQNDIQDIVEGLPTKVAKGSAPKQPSAAEFTQLFGHDVNQNGTPHHIDGELDKQMAARGLSLDANTQAIVRNGVLTRIQQGMNPVQAVGDTLNRLHEMALQRAAGRSGGPISNLSAERQQAQAAIQSGASPDQVKQLFRQRTGQEL